MTNGRDKGIVEINGNKYVVCPEGAFIDFEGNLRGFLCGDIVHECQMEEEDNFIDTLVSKANAKRAESETKAALVEPIIITAAIASAAIAIYEARRQAKEAEEEARLAEARAAEMQRRLEEARARHESERNG